MVPRLKRVCHLNLASSYGGGERQTELLVHALAQRDIAQRLVVTDGSGLAERCDGVEDLEVRVVSRSHLAAARAIRGCDLAHAHDGRSVYAALLGLMLFRTPYVVTRRVVKGKKIAGLRGVAYKRAARVVGISTAAVDDLRRGGLETDIALIRSARAALQVDDKAVARIRTARAGKLLIGHTGVLDDTVKGQSTLIEAARAVAEDHPDWHFMLLGEGKHRDRFMREIGSLTNVELTGWVDNVGDYLAAFDLFAFPSRHEALGSSLLDALQAGLPIVASNVGGIPDIVEDGVNGRLVRPGDAAQLVAAIESLLEDEAGLAEMRRRNVEKSLAFDVTHMTEAYETLYREIATPM